MREVSIVMGGLRITLTAEEADLLASTLRIGLDRLSAGEHGIVPAGDDVAEGIPSSPEAFRERTRALIRARMQDKGLSLWQGHRQ